MSLMHDAPVAKLPLPSTANGERQNAPRPGLELVSRSTEKDRARELTRAGFLLARTDRVAADGSSSPDLPVRGGLREAIEGAIEMALALRGAVPPNVGIGVGAHDMASDQLFRTRALGAKGLCLVVPELRRIANEERILDERDSEALRVWKALAEDEPVVLLLDENDRGVSVRLPIALDDWLARVQPLAGPTSVGWTQERALVEERYDSPNDFDFDPDELVLEGEPGVEPAASHQARHDEAARRVNVADTDRPTLRDAARAGLAKPAVRPPSEAHDTIMRHDPLAGLEDDLDDDGAEPTPGDVFDELFTAVARLSPTASEVPRAGLFTALTPSPVATDAMPTKREGRNIGPAKRPRQATNRRAMARALEPDAAAGDELDDAAMSGLQREPHTDAIRNTKTSDLPARPARRFDTASLRHHVATLLAARGSRPVKQIENLYVEHYAPLLEAFSAGFDDHDAERALTGWRTAFEKSYQESFASIRVTGKRPKMVLDAPEEAIRAGKLNGARSVQLLLVDAMRYGLGERVQRRLEASMSDIGTCVEKHVLWSALPSVTSVQMQLLSQGARSLRDIQTPSERDLTAFRDGTACIPRRERIGQRDLLKLDVVEARLRDPGGAFEARMDDLAAEVSDAVVKVAEGLPPRTMLYLFGDHGFHLRGVGAERTSRAEQGGSRPEEVLVPGYAWLIGGTH